MRLRAASLSTRFLRVSPRERLPGRPDRSRRGGGLPTAKLADEMIDLGLNFVAFLFQVTKCILEYGAVLIRFSSCHEFSHRHYIMEVIQSWSIQFRNRHAVSNSASQTGGFHIDNKLEGEIGPGLLVLIGIAGTDGTAEADYMAGKLVHLRVFSDPEGRMNRSALDVTAELLLISQFTLYGDCRKGQTAELRCRRASRTCP